MERSAVERSVGGAWAGKAFSLLLPLMSAVGTKNQTNRQLHVTLKWEIPTCVLLRPGAVLVHMKVGGCTAMVLSSQS